MGRTEMTIALGAAAVGLTAALAPRGSDPNAIDVALSEWTITLSNGTVPAGPVTFRVTNGGSVPHAFEIEGHGLEQKTPLIQPGARATLALTLVSGSYEIYCPVGRGAHHKLGMETHLKVVDAGQQARPDRAGGEEPVSASEPVRSADSVPSIRSRRYRGH